MSNTAALEHNQSHHDDNEFHYSAPVVIRAATDNDGREYWDVEISNQERDLHGTVFLMRGLRNIDEYNEDGIVQYGHPSFDSSDPDDVVGTSTVRIEGERLMARFYPEPGDTNPKAIKLVNKLRSGVIKSASIVAGVYKQRRGVSSQKEDPKTTYFESWDLLGWGFVAKGSNPKAKLRTIARAAEFHARADAALIDLDLTENVKTDTDNNTHDDEADLLALAESVSRSTRTLSECR
jgi:hypothetical protein